MKIKRVSIQNFRSIWKLDLPSEPDDEFGNLTIFIGKNNSGKSNIINALRLSLTQIDKSLIEKSLVKELPYSQYTWFFGYEDEPTKIEVVIGLDENEIKAIEEELKKEAMIEDLYAIKITVEISKESEKTLWKLTNVQLFGRVVPETIKKIDKTIETAKKITKVSCPLRGFLRTAQGISIVENCKIGNQKLLEALLNIISWSPKKVRYIYPARTIRANEPWDGKNEMVIPEDLQEDIKEIIKSPVKYEFHDYLTKVKEESNYIPGEYELTKYYEMDKIPLRLFGSGDQAFDGLVAAVERHSHYYKGSIIFIEEPEIHLHPELVREFATFIKEKSEESNIQLFIVTQSPEFIDPLIGKADIIIVKKQLRKTSLGDRPATECIKLKEDIEMIEDLIRELGSARILFSNVIFLVEGGDDAYLLRYWINNERKRFKYLKRYSISIVPFSKRWDILKIVKTLKEMGIEPIVFLDGDEEGKKNYEKLIDAGFVENVFRWGVADILGFIDGEKIVDALYNTIKELNVNEEKLNEIDSYKDKIKTIKEHSLKDSTGKKAFEDIMNIIYENSGSIKERYDKYSFRRKFKEVLGSELIKFKLETPREVIEKLISIDTMLKT